MLRRANEYALLKRECAGARDWLCLFAPGVDARFGGLWLQPRPELTEVFTGSLWQIQKLWRLLPPFALQKELSA
jgi:hypothetical protein